MSQEPDARAFRDVSRETIKHHNQMSFSSEPLPVPNDEDTITAESLPTRGPAPKKQRVIGPQYAKRKRASTACLFCRQRKTKCDNTRPVCGYCRYHRAKCIYEDENPEEKAPYDEASQEIIERLEELKHLLTSNNAASAQIAQPTVAQTPGSVSTPAAPSYMVTDNGLEPLTSMRAPFAALRCESLLRWSVFESVATQREKSISSFVLESESVLHELGHSGIAGGRGISGFSPGSESSPGTVEVGSSVGVQEDAFVPLCKKFLLLVHPRNPILEPDELIKYAKHAREHGLGWNQASCIVLLACALASCSIPWETATQSSDGLNSSNGLPADVSSADKATSEAYYLAAKKRIGLLGISIPDIQCLFFASVYEKYMLRPLQAWFYIQQASSRLQAHILAGGTRQLRSTNASDDHNYHLEQRLFWSCFKAESELAPELGLPPSGLSEFAYPDLFPSPPASLGRVQTEIEEGQPHSEERGWFFYLAEISLRRTIIDTIKVIYRKGETQWVNNIQWLVAQHDEQEQQVLLWQSYLPSSIQFPHSQLAENELSFFLQGRFLEWRQYLLKPFIYYVLHQPLDEKTGPQLISLAQSGIDICAQLIPHYLHNHRHGGIWFVSRLIWTCAVLILAVVEKKGPIQPPENWAFIISQAHGFFERWAPEALDVEHMRVLLLRLIDATYREEDLPG